MDNQSIIGHIYECFGKGDVPAILERISEDVKWEHWDKNHAQATGIAYMQRRQGKQGASDFFGTLAAIEMRDFKVLSILSGGNKVCVEVVIEFKVKATGKILRDEELHLWTLDDRGQVIGLRHYVDTAKHIEANTG